MRYVTGSWVSCMAHTLQLAVNDCFKAVHNMERIVGAASGALPPQHTICECSQAQAGPAGSPKTQSSARWNCVLDTLTGRGEVSSYCRPLRLLLHRSHPGAQLCDDGNNSHIQREGVILRRVPSGVGLDQLPSPTIRHTQQHHR